MRECILAFLLCIPLAACVYSASGVQIRSAAFHGRCVQFCTVQGDAD